MMGNAIDDVPLSLPWMYVYVDDVDATYKRALKLGATSEEEPSNKPYGDRRATIKDPFGNRWGIAKPTKGPVADRFRSVTPYLGGRTGAQLIEFMQKAFDATVLESGGDPAGDDFHGELTIGNSLVMVGGAPESSTHLYIYVADVDAVYARALKAGASSFRQPADQDYGDRMAGVKDPFGNIWWIATHIKDVKH
jgi:uncharacterized glyoxalase superfamily protein PhnB